MGKRYEVPVSGLLSVAMEPDRLGTFRSHVGRLGPMAETSKDLSTVSNGFPVPDFSFAGHRDPVFLMTYPLGKYCYFPTASVLILTCVPCWF